MISAWIGAFVIVFGALSIALLKVLPMLASLKEKITSLFTLHEANKSALEAQQAQITYVALSTPTAPQVEVTNTK